MEIPEMIAELARHAQSAPVPEVDVRHRLRVTLRALPAQESSFFDTPTLAFAGLSLAIMAAMFTLSLPAISALRDPWSAYMATPWSF